LLLVLLLAACQPVQPVAQGAEAAPIHEITLIGTDHAFDGPDTVPAGWTRIRLENRGEDLHHAQLVKVPEDATMDDVMAAFQQIMEQDVVPEGLAFAGGPGIVVPGASTEVIVKLGPGQYVFICGLPDAEGVPHAAHGMVHFLTVTEAETANTEAPDALADITLDMFDFNYAVSVPVTAGAHTIKVVNSGEQPHEMLLFQLALGATVPELLAFLEAEVPSGPPPGMPLGGMQVIEPGAEGYFHAEFVPGAYVIVCFFPDEESGTPHVALGMVQQIVVE
jgi:hypothetical protein